MAELWWYIKDICRHWAWWASSTIIAAALAIYQGGGGVIPAWLLWTWATAGIFVAMFLAWRDQYRNVQELTKKAPIEIIDDLIQEGEELEKWISASAYARERKTKMNRDNNQPIVVGRA